MSAVASPRALLGRGQVLGTFREVAELSAAFGSDGEARLALPGAADGAIATLVRAVFERVDMDIWVWGYGEGPDDLVTLSHARELVPGLDAAFDGAEEDEAIALLALLDGSALSHERRVLSPRARTLLGAKPPGAVHCPLALRAGPDDVARRVRSFRSHGGPDLPFWTADRTLGIRFSLDRDGVSFKAHHHVIQEELLHRCEREGIDVA